MEHSKSLDWSCYLVVVYESGWFSHRLNCQCTISHSCSTFKSFGALTLKAFSFYCLMVNWLVLKSVIEALCQWATAAEAVDKWRNWRNFNSTTLLKWIVPHLRVGLTGTTLLARATMMKMMTMSNSFKFCCCCCLATTSQLRQLCTFKTWTPSSSSWTMHQVSWEIVAS